MSSRMNLKIVLFSLAMVAAATASQSYRQPSYHGTHDEPYSYYSESQSYNTPSYKSTHGASYYDEPITIKGKSYRLDSDSNKNNDYTFVTISGDDHYDVEKKMNKDDHYESSYHQVDDKLHYGSSNSYKGSSYNRPSYQKQEPTYKVHREEPSYKTPSYQTTHKREPSYMVQKKQPSYMVHKEEPSYKMQNYKQEPSYMVHKEEPSYKMQSYKQETPYKTYQQSHHDSYQQPTHYKESNNKQHSYKETYGKQDQYQDNRDGHDLYHSNYQQAYELISNAGMHGYSTKSKAPIIVKMTTMNNNKNVYNKQYDH